MPNIGALTSAIEAAGCPITGVSVTDPNDKTTWVVQFPSGTTAAQQQAAAQVVAGWSDPRSATVSALFDALSATQRAAITVDHMARLTARAALGPVLIVDPKIVRAAADMGLTPDAWFKLAGA